MESIILGSPLIVTLYGIAILICIYDLIKRASGYVFSAVSVALFVGATVYAILLGAYIEEIEVVTLIFLALNLGTYLRCKGDKK